MYEMMAIGAAQTKEPNNKGLPTVNKVVQLSQECSCDLLRRGGKWWGWLRSQKPTSYSQPEDHGHNRPEDVVGSAGNHRREDVAARQPGEQDRQGRLEANQWRKADEDADGHPAGDRLRRVANRQQLQRVLMEPALAGSYSTSVRRLNATASSYRTPLPPKMSSADPMVRSTLPLP